MAQLYLNALNYATVFWLNIPRRGLTKVKKKYRVRRRKEGGKMEGPKTISVRLSGPLVQAFDALAKHWGNNQSDALRRLIENAVSGESCLREGSSHNSLPSRVVLSVEGLEDIEVLVLVRPEWDRASLRAFVQGGYFFLQITATMTISIREDRLPQFPLGAEAIVDGITFYPRHRWE